MDILWRQKRTKTVATRHFFWAKIISVFSQAGLRPGSAEVGFALNPLRVIVYSLFVAGFGKGMKGEGQEWKEEKGQKGNEGTKCGDPTPV